MANWITFGTPELNDAKVAALVTALRTAALAQGQTDPSPRIVQQVVDRLRRKIESNRKNVVDADATTIPASLLPMATMFAVVELKNRLQQKLTDYETERVQRYERDLDRIADGTDVVEQPDNAVDPDVQATAGTPRITRPHHHFDRRSQDGI